MTHRIPLVVLGGFLGAGKTTLLNHLLTQSGGRRIAVLVNDFGPVNVDAGLIAEHDGETISLTNGCVCCSMGSGLEDALIRVLERSPVPDLIVIEASGVSDPGRIAQVGLSDPMLQLETIVVMVDSEQVVSQLDDPLLGDTLARQIAAASLLVLNKTDLVDSAGLSAVRARLAAQFGSMAMLEASHARVPVQLLAGGADLAAGLETARKLDCADAPALGMEAAPHAPDGHHHHHAAGKIRGVHPVDPQALSPDPDHPFEGGSWRGEGVLDADQLTAALKRLPRTVIRVKGWVTTERHGRVIVHLAGGRVRFERVSSKAGAAMNELVYIGIRGADIHTAMHDALGKLTDHRDHPA
jgi:G3E family GTPase